MTDANCEGLPDARGEIVSARETGSDLGQVTHASHTTVKFTVNQSLVCGYPDARFNSRRWFLTETFVQYNDAK